MLTHTRRVVAPEELKKGLEWADSQGDSFRLVASTQLRATALGTTDVDFVFLFVAHAHSQI